MSSNLGQALSELSDPVVSRYIELGIAKELTPAEMVSVPGPAQVSNRTIYDRCLAWGCRITKTNGNWVWMVSPMGIRFKIRPPQQHVANGRPDIEKLLNAMILPWSIFMGAEILDKDYLLKIGEGFKKTGGAEEAPDDEMGPCDICEEGVIRAVMVKRGKKIAHSYCVKKVAEAEAQPVEVEPVETIEEEIQEVAAPDEQENPKGEPGQVEVASLPRGRYINSVFDLLVERGDPMSNRAVAEALGIKPEQAGSSLAHLANLGVVVRVKSGVYQAKPGLMRKAGTMGLVISGSVEQESRSFSQIQPRGYERPVPVTFSTVDSISLEPSAEEDETLNELLDLMAPGGFRARHLPLIDAFKSCALALMREINEVA